MFDWCGCFPTTNTPYNIIQTQTLNTHTNTHYENPYQGIWAMRNPMDHGPKLTQLKFSEVWETKVNILGHIDSLVIQFTY